MAIFNPENSQKSARNSQFLCRTLSYQTDSCLFQATFQVLIFEMLKINTFELYAQNIFELS